MFSTQHTVNYILHTDEYNTHFDTWQHNFCIKTTDERNDFSKKICNRSRFDSPDILSDSTIRTKRIRQTITTKKILNKNKIYIYAHFTIQNRDWQQFYNDKKYNNFCTQNLFGLINFDRIYWTFSINRLSRK